MAEIRFRDVDYEDVIDLIDIFKKYQADVILTPEELSFEDIDKEEEEETRTLRLVIGDMYFIDNKPYEFIEFEEDVEIEGYLYTYFHFLDENNSIFTIESEQIGNYKITESWGPKEDEDIKDWRKQPNICNS